MVILQSGHVGPLAVQHVGLELDKDIATVPIRLHFLVEVTALHFLSILTIGPSQLLHQQKIKLLSQQKIKLLTQQFETILRNERTKKSNC